MYAQKSFSSAHFPTFTLHQTKAWKLSTFYAYIECTSMHRMRICAEKQFCIRTKDSIFLRQPNIQKKRNILRLGYVNFLYIAEELSYMEVSVFMLFLIWWLHLSECRIDEMNNNIFCENIEVDIWSHKNIHHTSILMKLEIRHMPKAIQKYRKIIFKDRKKYGFYICNFSKNTIHPMCVFVL